MRRYTRELDTVSSTQLTSSLKGTDPNRPTLVAIKGIVFDVTRNEAYSPTGQYRGTLL